MADGLSLRDFGRQLNVTSEAVRKAIASGKIPADCVGERIVGKGTKWPVIINAERAAAHWGHNRDPNQVRDKATMSAGAKRGWKQRRDEEPEADEPDHDQDHPEPPAATNGSRLTAGRELPSVNDSKKVTEAYKARTARLDYEERVGRLVNADQVKVGFTNLVSAARTRLMAVPSKAKGRIPHLTVSDVEALEDLIAEALEDLALGR